MAIEPKKTKAERRTEGRAERKAEAERAAKEAKKRRLISIGSTVGVTALVIAVVALAVTRDRGGQIEDLEITLVAAEAARETAGCEVLVDGEPLPDRTHLTPAEAPPADILYAAAQVRPTYSGSHFNVVSPRVDNIPRSPIEERSVVHNMEHGAIAVWFDADQLDGSGQNAMGDWGEARNDAGFTSAAGAAIFTSAYDGTITSGKAVAFRAWGEAMDCDTFDQTVADAWTIDYYGTHGIAPERNLAPYPNGVLGYGDSETGDTPEGDAPQDGESDLNTDPAGVETGTDLPSDATETASDGAADPGTAPATESDTTRPTETNSAVPSESET